MKISISSPFPVESLQGNSVSARRIGRFLQQSGHEVEVSHNRYADDCDVFIALNAWRSAPIIKHFATTVPGTVQTVPGTVCPKLVVMMTGSDLYPFDGELKEETLESIRLADQVIVTTDNATQLIDHQNISIIRKSIVLPEFPKVDAAPKDSNSCRGIMVAHLREQKNPFLFLRCLPYLGRNIRVDHYGNALDSFRDQAIRYRSDRYQWHEALPREQLLAELSKADFYLNTSYMEGSSNALCEAICLDIPVIASDIPGNVGVLGNDYLGLFKSDDRLALAERLETFDNDSDFRKQIDQQTIALKSTLDPAVEQRCWAELVESLSKS